MSSCGECIQCTFTNTTPFITAQNGTYKLCCGTTQDIPAGLYQPQFQDTTSLSYAATVTAKNTHTHTHTRAHAHTDKHMSTLTTEASQQRQRRLIQTQGETDSQENKAAPNTKTIFSYLSIFYTNLSYTRAKYYTYR